MKIAVPVDNKSIDSDVCVSFGRTPYFLIYNTELKTCEFIENTAADAHGGAGIKAAQIIVDNGVEALISVRLGENAANVLNVSEVRLYKSCPVSANKNIELFLEDKLEIQKEIHAGFHNHGGK